MAKKGTLLTGIDIGSSTVKVCQLSKTKRGYNLVSLGSAAIPVGAVEDGVLVEPDEVGNVISALFKNLKIKSDKVAISLSGHSVIVKKIKVDPMDEEDMFRFVNDELDRYIPFDPDDVYFDFADLKTARGGNFQTDVMLAAAKKGVVNDYLEMLSEQKLKTYLVDVDNFALENIWDETSGAQDNVALIDIGASRMNINIIADGVSALARDIVAGGDNLTREIAAELGVDYDEAEGIKLGLEPADEYREALHKVYQRVCTQWVLEIKKAIDLFSSNNKGRTLERILLTGGSSKVKGLPEFIEKETDLEVVTFNPFANMGVNSKLIDADYVEAAGPEMTIAAGLAIRPIEF